MPLFRGNFAFLCRDFLLHLFQLHLQALRGLRVLQGLIGGKAKEIGAILRFHLPLRQTFREVPRLLTQCTQPLAAIIKCVLTGLEQLVLLYERIQFVLERTQFGLRWAAQERGRNINVENAQSLWPLSRGAQRIA